MPPNYCTPSLFSEVRNFLIFHELSDNFVVLIPLASTVSTLADLSQIQSSENVPVINGKNTVSFLGPLKTNMFAESICLVRMEHVTQRAV